jgi:hypothetical protein
MTNDARPAGPDAIRASSTVVYFDGREWRYDRPRPESCFVALHRAIEREYAVMLAELERSLRTAREAIRYGRMNAREIELDELWAVVRPMLARQTILHNALIEMDSKIANLGSRLKGGVQTGRAASPNIAGPDDNGPTPAA